MILALTLMHLLIIYLEQITGTLFQMFKNIRIDIDFRAQGTLVIMRSLLCFNVTNLNNLVTPCQWL